MNLYILLLIILSIIIYLIGKTISQSILHPIRLMSLMWIVFIFFPMLFWNNGYRWNGNGLIWLLLFVLATELGALLVNDKMRINFKLNKNIKFNWIILKIIIFLGFVSFLLQLRASGFNLSSFSSFESIINMNKTVAIQRYSGNLQTSTISQLFLFFIYLSALCGGYSYNFSENNKHRFLSTVGSFIPIFGNMFFSNTKSGFISCIILWLAGFSISYILLNGKLPKIKANILIKMIILFFLIIGLLYFVMLLRTGSFSAHTRKIIFDKLWVYAFGHIVNFDHWFSLGNDFSKYSFGMNTYMAFFKQLGLIERVQGVYTDYYYGNVYTAFRAIIMDFGIIGGLFYGFLKGAITQYCFNRISTGDLKSSISCTLLICSYFWYIYGFIISAWCYTSYVLTIPIFWYFLLLVHKRIRWKRSS